MTPPLAAAYAGPVRPRVAPAGPRSAPATSAPSRARASAIARPMPRAAPVTSATWPVRSVGRENDLPEVIALLELAVRFRRRRQRKHGVDHGLEQPGGERAEQRAELPGGADVGAVERLVLAVELEERQHDVVARRVAADHEATAPGERPEALGPGRGADVVDDDVRAPAASEPSHLVDDALLMVGERAPGPQAAGPLALGDAAGGRDHPGAVGARDLDGRASHPAGAGDDEHRLARPEGGAGDQHVPGGEEHDGDGGGLDEGERGRDREHVRARHADQLGVAAVDRAPEDADRDARVVPAGRTELAAVAGQRRLEHHPRADRQVTPRARARRDLARDVRAEDVRQPLLAQAAAYPDVPTVERTGPYADEDLAGRRLGIRPLAELDDLGAPVPLDHGGPHRGPPTASTTPLRP